MLDIQNHLSFTDKINLGSYYTPKKIVDLVYNLIKKNINDYSSYILLDTSCGYGSFFNIKNNNLKIGADIDHEALKIAKNQHPTVNFLNHNSLINVNRKQYNILNNEKLIILGNPPYNDTTSIIKNSIKKNNNNIDLDLKTRDLGISFLLSYNKLFADYICVLHPLSYLIKEANFKLLKKFTENYILKDSIIMSSHEFSEILNNTPFPIIIALYERNSLGMKYDFILNYHFKTIENKIFELKKFDKISNYITKYPNSKHIPLTDTTAFFWTMRDINALKRTKTFISQESYNTIRVTKDNIEYYCYVDNFKDYIKHVPYYFGNCDVFIDNLEFQKIKNVFIEISLNKYAFLKSNYKAFENNFCNEISKNKLILAKYFKNLLGEHYVN